MTFHCIKATSPGGEVVAAAAAAAADDDDADAADDDSITCSLSTYPGIAKLIFTARGKVVVFQSFQIMPAMTLDRIK